MFYEDYANVNGVRLHYVSHGHGKLILFLHGFPEFWYAWRHQLAVFGADYQAVAPDMRGYNLSSRPPEVERYAMPTLVEDIRALAGRLTTEPFVLVGHDWGGIVAWSLAAAHPALLDRLVIINAPHPALFQRELRENPAQRRASQYILTFRRAGAEAMLEANDYRWLTNAVLKPGLAAGYWTQEDVAAYRAAWAQPGALTGALNYYRATWLASSQQEAGGTAQVAAASPIDVPTLVLWGEQDTFLLTGNLQGLEHYVTLLTIRRVPDASHWLVHEQPALVDDAIRAFIRA